jgi:lipopolysaccharide assembly protein A
MQLVLVLGIVFAIVAVLFALQNNIPVAVTLAVWHFEGSLALVLLIAVGLGVLITGLVSSPAVIRGQWQAARLRRRVADLEREAIECQAQNRALAAEVARLSPSGAEALAADAEEKPYVGMRALLAGEPNSRDDGTRG